MNRPGIVSFLYILGGFSLLGGGFSFFAGCVDGNAVALAIGASATIEGAVLLALGKIILLMSNR